MIPRQSSVLLLSARSRSLLLLQLFLLLLLSKYYFTMSDAEDTVETGTEETFVLDEWVKAAGLSRKATNTLRREDLTTERTLKLLERRASGH